MFKRNKRIISNKLEIGNYVEEFDIYNSLFLKRLLDPSNTREKYKITLYEYRPDLIAKDYYGSEDYMAILLIETGKELGDFKKGEYLDLIPKDIVDSILESM